MYLRTSEGRLSIEQNLYNKVFAVKKNKTYPLLLSHTITRVIESSNMFPFVRHGKAVEGPKLKIMKCLSR